jgi:xeroderma pigmentosum group C-complementing protein
LEAWRLNFRLTGHGISRPLWPATSEESQARFEVARDTEAFVDLADFRGHALDFEGSADYSAQLFCALLRSLEIETRLVFSLQPLGFDARGAGQATNDETMNQIRIESSTAPQKSESSEDPVTPHRHSRLSRANGRASCTPQTLYRRTVRVPKPRHAVFWVEAFDEAYQKWIPMDPAITGTIGKASVFEPALNDPENVMTYVVAFENSGAVRDVTVRYAKAFIAKTQKFRVESTEMGATWFKRAIKPFRRRIKLDRDTIEDAQLLQREVSEGMPKNIEDFKNHPIYVLERHLKKHEVLYPKNKVGQIAQRGSSTAVELVYRRKDVHGVKSGDKWFRMGRQVKTGEVPLKRITRKKRRMERNIEPDDGDDQVETVALYAAFQTELYVPDPVVNGRVPRNGFRNLDVYVPSMIPFGGVHVKSSCAKVAARLIGVDAVDAVTGFDFRGRNGTARINGVIVASEYKDAVVAVAEDLAAEARMTKARTRLKEERKRQRRAILERRIRARVRREYGSGDEDYSDDELEDGSDSDSGSGPVGESNSYHFMFDEANDDVVVVESTSKPLGTRTKIIQLTEEEDMELFGQSQESLVEADVNPGGFVPENDEEPLGGGFIVDNDLPNGIFVDVLPEISTAKSTFKPYTMDTSPPLGRQEPDVDSMKADSLKEPQKQLAETPSTGAEREGLRLQGYKRSASADTITSRGSSMLSHDPEDEDADPDWLD